ncbi:MAG TPA: hypothetical protein DEA08_25120 [Planctomycetes bacterium]|nr:hypothetical protein [Planctomycetota bacterium]
MICSDFHVAKERFNARGIVAVLEAAGVELRKAGSTRGGEWADPARSAVAETGSECGLRTPRAPGPGAAAASVRETLSAGRVISRGSDLVRFSGARACSGTGPGILLTDAGRRSALASSLAGGRNGEPETERRRPARSPSWGARAGGRGIRPRRWTIAPRAGSAREASTPPASASWGSCARVLALTFDRIG